MVNNPSSPASRAERTDLGEFETRIEEMSLSALEMQRKKYEEMLDELGDAGDHETLKAKLDIIKIEIASRP